MYDEEGESKVKVTAWKRIGAIFGCLLAVFVLLYCLFALLLIWGVIEDGDGNFQFDYTEISGEMAYIQERSNIAGADAFLPDYSKFQDCEKIHIQYNCNSMVVTLQYSSELYETVLHSVLEDNPKLKFEQLEWKQGMFGTEYQALKEIEADYGKYHYYVVYHEGFEYPNRFGMVGYNEEEQRIRYMYHDFYSHEQVMSIGQLIWEETYENLLQ